MIRDYLYKLGAALLLITALSSFTACGDDSPTDPGGGGGPEGPSGWFWQNPKPFGHAFNQIDAPATDVAVAVGPGGLIMRTTDGGVSWERQASGTQEELTRVSFFDAQNGFVIGSDVLLHTTDGGSTWTDRSTSELIGMGDISTTGPLSATIIYLFGSILAQTTDGGLSWSTSVLPLQARGRAIDFVSPSTGFIAAFNQFARGAIALSTTDGGTNWTRVDTTIDFIPRDLFALDASTAWIVGDQGYVLRTSDGGQNWSSVTVAPVRPTSRNLNSVAFLSTDVGYVAMSWQAIHKTTDGGQTWSVVYDQSPHFMASIAFADNSQGIVVGTGGTVLLSGDGGDSWSSTTEAVAFGRLQDVSFSSSQRGTAVGMDEIVSTTDGGSTWTDQASNQLGQPADFLRSVSFVDASNGVAVGDGGEIIWTDNGGQSWVRQTSPSSKDLLGVHVLDGSTAVAVGAGRQAGMVIMKTIDGGGNWEQQLNTAPSDSVLTAVWFSDANNGIAVGYDDDNPDGIILRTTDGGETWAAITGFDHTYLLYYDVCFVDANLGFIVGEDDGRSEGVLLRTTDGGLSWEHRVSGRDFEVLLAVSFSDLNNGIAVGRDGQVLVTSDGGLTWNAQSSGVGLRFEGVAMPSAGTATIVGDDGAILRTTTGGIQ